MTQQYLRALKVVIGNGNEAYEFSDLHCRFQVRNADVQTLKTLDLTIYNVSKDMANRIGQKEFTRVEVSAGYQGNLGLIFQGDLTMIRLGWENATDSYVSIQAADGDLAFNWGISNISLAKGYLPSDIYKKALQDLSKFGISQGYKPEFSQNPSNDALAFCGMTRDLLRGLADNQKCRWSIENGQLNFLPINSVYPGAVPLITPASGLIGYPTQTLSGIEMLCLLNPQIRAGGKVNLGNSSINTLSITEKLQTPAVVPTIDGAGAYKVAQAIHTGDSRGNSWYTNIIGVAVDGTAPLVGPTQTQVPDNG